LDGNTHLAQFNQDAGGDFGDWYSPGGQTPQIQDAFATAGSAPVLGVELRVLDVLGYHRVTPSLLLTASAGSGGTITPAGTITRNTAENQAFTATPNANYAVNQWLLDGNLVQTGGVNYTLSNILAGHTVQVTFTNAPSKLDQSITFPALTNKTIGEPPFTLSATASSGLPVSFAILSGPATNSGAVLTLTNTGTVVVRASQAGDANYNAATNVYQSFTADRLVAGVGFARCGQWSKHHYGNTDEQSGVLPVEEIDRRANSLCL